MSLKLLFTNIFHLNFDQTIRLHEDLIMLQKEGKLPPIWHWDKEHIQNLNELYEHIISDLKKINSDTELISKLSDYITKLRKFLELLLTQNVSSEIQEKESIIANQMIETINSHIKKLEELLQTQNELGSTLGDLTPPEIQQIQDCVNKAGFEIYVVGSAAKGKRRNVGSNLPLSVFGQIKDKIKTKSDIDYAVASKNEFEADKLDLPDKDSSFGVRGIDYLNLSSSPAIKFSKNSHPIFLSVRTTNCKIKLD